MNDFFEQKAMDWEIDPTEQAHLDALADELQQELQQPALSAGFVDQLQERMQAEPWTLRSALHRNRMLRLAASLLLITTVAGPVSALVILFTKSDPQTPGIIWDPPASPLEIEEAMEPKVDPAIPPIDPDLEEAFGMDWHAAIEQSNRMALVIRQWEEAHQDVASDQAPLAPALMDWRGATVEQIEQEFRRRCMLGINTPPPGALAERVLDLQNAEKGQDWVRAWQWVLQGSGLEIEPFFQR